MVYDKLKELLCTQLGVDESMITPDTNIMDDLGADSLDVVELISALEDEFNIMITDERVREMNTVQEVADFIDGMI